VDDPTIRALLAVINRRLKALEDQIEVLSSRAGVVYARPDDGIPDSVRDLAAAGRKIEAIKELRAATGLDLASAKEMVENL
jgi:ribosomal protein L7/L12